MPSDDAKSVAEAGFEEGLAILIEVMPAASIVIDALCRVLASNTAASAFVDQLSSAEIRRVLGDAVASASCGKDPGLVMLNQGSAEQAYVIMPLPGRSTSGRDLFLLSRIPDEADQKDTPKTTLNAYELAPTPARELREQALKFKRLSETDPLTGALNVRAFAARVRQSLTRNPGRKGAMIFLDLNGFKAINDRFGHAAGDKVLVHVASKLTFPPHTWIVTARMGGDEFALWIPFVERTSLSKITDGLRARLRTPVDLSEFGAGGDAHVAISAAIGAVHCPDEAMTYEVMRRLADARMYDDKEKTKEHHPADAAGLKKKGGR